MGIFNTVKIKNREITPTDLDRIALSCASTKYPHCWLCRSPSCFRSQKRLLHPGFVYSATYHARGASRTCVCQDSGNLYNPHEYQTIIPIIHSYFRIPFTFIMCYYRRYAIWTSPCLCNPCPDYLLTEFVMCTSSKPFDNTAHKICLIPRLSCGHGVTLVSINVTFDGGYSVYHSFETPLAR